MPVIGKFYVASTSRYSYNADALQVVLQAVSRGDENKEWAAATPSGKIELTIANGAASKVFEERLGKEFYVTFDEAEVPAETHAFRQSERPYHQGQEVCGECGEYRQSPRHPDEQEAA